MWVDFFSAKMVDHCVVLAHAWPTALWQRGGVLAYKHAWRMTATSKCNGPLFLPLPVDLTTFFAEPVGGSLHDKDCTAGSGGVSTDG